MKRLVPVLILLLILCGCIQPHGVHDKSKKSSLTIFCAGSLSIPLNDLNEEFRSYMKSAGYDVDIKIEPSGSVMAVRKITDLGRRADVVAVADYTLLKDFMYPDFANFYIAFARNELVLCYTDNSRYCEEINVENWFEILNRDGVRFGFSNPNIDPCGYRSLMAMKLADMKYGKHVFRNLIENNTNIRCEGNRIIAPRNIRTDGKIVIRDKSVDLISLLEGNCIDYSFEYRSVAMQHGLRFLELPDEINLGNESLGDLYGKVSVVIWKMRDGKIVQSEIRGKPIVYGVTIPRNSENPEIALKYLIFLLGDKGRDVFERNHQEFLRQPLGFGKIPDDLKDLVKICGG